jgi:hypothetical protein
LSLDFEPFAAEPFAPDFSGAFFFISLVEMSVALRFFGGGFLFHSSSELSSLGGSPSYGSSGPSLYGLLGQYAGMPPSKRVMIA